MWIWTPGHSRSPKSSSGDSRKRGRFPKDMDVVGQRLGISQDLGPSLVLISYKDLVFFVLMVVVFQFPPYLKGNDPILTNVFFQMGWNYQPPTSYSMFKCTWLYIQDQCWWWINELDSHKPTYICPPKNHCELFLSKETEFFSVCFRLLFFFERCFFCGVFCCQTNKICHCFLQDYFRKGSLLPSSTSPWVVLKHVLKQHDIGAKTERLVNLWNRPFRWESL